jgi:hypothetical protein
VVIVVVVKYSIMQYVHSGVTYTYEPYGMIYASTLLFDFVSILQYNILQNLICDPELQTWTTSTYSQIITPILSKSSYSNSSLAYMKFHNCFF